MVRGLKTLCFVLSSTGLAVRQNVKVEKAGAAVHMMDTIKSLLEAHKAGRSAEVNEHLRSLASVTPGQSDAMDAAIRTLTNTLESDVMRIIQQHFDATQQEIDSRINALSEATDVAVRHKGEADTADSTWFTCVENEKSKKVNIETAEHNLQVAEDSVHEPCDLKAANKIFERAYPEPHVIDCAFADGNCPQQMDDFDNEIQRLLSALETDSGDQVAVWNDANTRCKAAHDDVAQKKVELGDAESAWSQQRTTCVSNHATRRVDMCEFGDELRVKCEKLSLYNQLISEVTADVGVHSLSEREDEHHTTFITKCLLEDHLNNDVLSNPDAARSTIERCSGEENFIEQVGDMKLAEKQAQVDALTTADQFTCLEATITFSNGLEWQVPEGTDVHSDGYTTHDFHPEFEKDRAVAEHPFGFCAL